MTNFVLHVGVNQYPSFAPDGSRDLQGAVNDARRWRRYTREALAVPDARAEVLEDGAVTRKELLAALARLAGRMAERPGSSGLVTFSGHGAASDATGETAGAGIGLTIALCPSDTGRDGDRLTNLVSLADVEAALGAAAPDTTIVVDACYTRVAGTTAPLRGLGQGPAPALPTRVASRLILGAEPWSQSYEIRSGGNWHGALTFSMLTLLEQWSVQRTDGAAWANVSYGDLLYRTHLQLDVLGLGQRPLLLGPARTNLLPFLRPGEAIAAGATSPVPDLRRPGSQLSAGNAGGGGGYRIYAIVALTEATPHPTLAHVLVAKDSHGDYAKNYEYWFVHGVPAGKLRNPSNGSLLVTGYRVALEVDRSGWTQLQTDLDTYDMSGTPFPNAISQNYTNPAWTAPSGLGSLGGRKDPSISDAPAGLWMKVSTTNPAVLEKVWWFASTTGTQTQGWFTDLTPGGGCNFETSFTTPGSAWGWWLQDNT